MHSRKALLMRLASITDWEVSSHAPFAGECWLESRNTLYRFLDGVCVAVGSQSPRRHVRAGTLIGMRLVGWLAGSAERSLFTYEWQAGACAVLWRNSHAGSDEAMAMTSPSTTFTRGHSAALVQALHDRMPPADSQTFRRKSTATHATPGSRAPVGSLPRSPSQPSYRSG